MALSAQAALLDELMGKNRNAAPGERVKNCHFSDSEVCKHFLCGFCPHELFVNTRADLGPCEKIHDENLRKQYENSSRKGKMGYEDAFDALLRSLLSDVEKRIKKGKDRLSLTQGSDDKLCSVRRERIQALNQQIDVLIAEADFLGREGNVESAKETLERCERLKVERLDLETRCINENAKAMEVCNVCGSFLIVGDAQCRVEEHITGKQHVGFARIRSTVEEMKANRDKIAEGRRKAREDMVKKYDKERKDARSSDRMDGRRNRSPRGINSSSASSHYYDNGGDRWRHRRSGESNDMLNNPSSSSRQFGRHRQEKNSHYRKEGRVENGPARRMDSPGMSPERYRDSRQWGRCDGSTGDRNGRRYHHQYDKGMRQEKQDYPGQHGALPESFDSWDELVGNASIVDMERSQHVEAKSAKGYDLPSDSDTGGGCSLATRNALLSLAGCAPKRESSLDDSDVERKDKFKRRGDCLNEDSGERHGQYGGKTLVARHDSRVDSSMGSVEDQRGRKKVQKRRCRKRSPCANDSCRSSVELSSDKDETMSSSGFPTCCSRAPQHVLGTEKTLHEGDQQKGTAIVSPTKRSIHHVHHRRPKKSYKKSSARSRCHSSSQSSSERNSREHSTSTSLSSEGAKHCSGHSGRRQGSRDFDKAKQRKTDKNDGERLQRLASTETSSSLSSEDL